MVFVTKEHDGKPLFRGFVNGISERTTSNGGKVTTYTIGTREKRRDDTYEYSSWFVNMIGDAKKKCGELQKGDMIDVYGFKMNNISQKNEDGTWGKSFFHMYVNDYVIHGEKKQSASSSDSEYPDDSNPF